MLKNKAIKILLSVIVIISFSMSLSNVYAIELSNGVTDGLHPFNLTVDNRSIRDYISQYYNSFTVKVAKAPTVTQKCFALETIEITGGELNIIYESGKIETIFLTESMITNYHIMNEKYIEININYKGNPIAFQTSYIVIHAPKYLHTDSMGNDGYDMICAICNTNIGRAYRNEDGYYYLSDVRASTPRCHFVFDDNCKLVKTEECTVYKWLDFDTYFEGYCKCHLILTTEYIYFKRGDVNCDEKINSIDALIALRHSVGLEWLEGNAFLAADVNKDLAVNSVDALEILQYSVGQITEFY